MKILLIHTTDQPLGGGAVQMNRLRTGLVERGVQARVLCRQPTNADSVAMPRTRVTEHLLQAVTRRAGLNDIHRIGAFKVPRLAAFVESDLIDIHSIHSNFFSYLALPRITAAKPTVFTFHDMWPLTGHCHASLECTHWRTGCRRCPHLDIAPPVRRDATAIEWRLKRWVYRRSHFTIVCPSRWLCDRVRESVLKDFPIRHIPHGVDVRIFQPFDKRVCRSLLGIPEGRHVLLVVVESLDRPLKGGDLLVQALHQLPHALKASSVLLLVGNGGSRIARLVDLPMVDLGFVRDERLKVLAYSAADLFLHPTRAESFGLVLLESMACGTPVVSFRVGGVPELARHGITGCVAEPESAAGFAAHIVELLGNPGLRSLMAQRCREVVLAEYSLDLQVDRYLRLYGELIESASKPPVRQEVAAPRGDGTPDRPRAAADSHDGGGSLAPETPTERRA